MTQLMRKILEIFSKNKNVQRLFKKYVHKDVMGINHNPCDEKQKHALLVYLSPMFREPYKHSHANWAHFYQMLYVLTKLDYCIDICDCHDKGGAARFTEQKYNLIIGFGHPYKEIVSNHKEAFKILFITENVPDVVRIKYKDRLVYFKERHPEIKRLKDNSRIKYYDEGQIKVSDACIIMNSPFNSAGLDKYHIPYREVVGNAIVNSSFKYEYSPCGFEANRKRFVLFGCNGLIHKGLDILFDVFRQLPEYTLDVFGLAKEDKDLFLQLKPDNCHDCGTVNVMSQEFLSKVVDKHDFVILNSCSEAMNTGVITCMRHGLIPIVSQEVGIYKDATILLQDYSVDSILSVIHGIDVIPTEELLKLRERAYLFAKENYSIKRFSETFTDAINQLTKDKF